MSCAQACRARGGDDSLPWNDREYCSAWRAGAWRPSLVPDSRQQARRICSKEGRGIRSYARGIAWALLSLFWDSIKFTLEVGFVCPFVVFDPTDLSATRVG